LRPVAFALVSLGLGCFAFVVRWVNNTHGYWKKQYPKVFIFHRAPPNAQKTTWKWFLEVLTRRFPDALQYRTDVFAALFNFGC
jgi:hypothetical protein